MARLRDFYDICHSSLTTSFVTFLIIIAEEEAKEVHNFLDIMKISGISLMFVHNFLVKVVLITVVTQLGSYLTDTVSIVYLKILGFSKIFVIQLETKDESNININKKTCFLRQKYAYW